MSHRIKSDFLVAAPSLVAGAGRLMDWYAIYNTYNISRSGSEADAKAMYADWAVVGQDIHDAIHKFEGDDDLLKAA